MLAFAALLIGVSAAPVLAADGEAGIPPTTTEVVEPPGPAQVAEAIAAAEKEKEARERELEAPAAQQEQKESVGAYGDISAQEARQLLLSTFSDSLLRLNADPARYLSEAKLVKAYGEGVATVSEDGNGSLLEANIPIRAEDEEGQLSKVDLDLEVTENGFEPENPLVDLALPETTEDPIAVGDDGLSVLPLGADHVGQQVGEQDVFYPEVHEDTDLLVAPIASGVEIFDQLRSGASPEELSYRLSLPAGAQLRSNGAGGAEIISDGEVIAYVAPANAVDAQGTVVPVELDVDGETITIVVLHRDKEFTYPILVDPVVHENYEGAWYGGPNFDALDKPGIWQWSGDPTMTYYLADTRCIKGSPLCSPSGRGLFVEALDGWIPANAYQQWYYTVPGGTTFIPSIYPTPSVVVNQFYRHNNGCTYSQAPEPHDYAGTFDANGKYTSLYEDRAQWYGNASIYDKAKGIGIGLSTRGQGVNLPCNRDIMVGGVSVRLDDPEAPTLTSVTGLPTGWVKGGQSFTVTANIYDPGLGVQNVKVYPKGRPSIAYVSESSECPGTKTNPCPYSRSAQFSLNDSYFDEGEKEIQVSGYDPTQGVEGTSNTFTQMMRVDRSGPTITLGGSLAKATEEDKPESEDPEKWDELSRPFYSLRIEAKDGSNTSPEAKRSGVKRVEIYLDGQLAISPPWSTSSCVSSCEISKTYDLPLATLATGKHTVKVVAFDWLDQSRERTVEFEYFPATGDKDEYVMERFPLPNGTDPDAPNALPWPEISVNVATGNVLFEQRDIDVEGPAVDLEIERVYNSLLPPQDDSEWGDGWTIAQTPDLEPVDTGGTPAPDEAAVLDSSGTIEDEVALPAEAGAVEFDPGLQAAVTKQGMGYELEDESGESAGSVVFDASGRAQQFLAGGDEEGAEVDYGYEEGQLSEVAVHDPTSSSDPPAEPPVIPAEGKPTFVKSFGWGFSVAGVARDSEGNIWVVEKGNRNILKYSSSGESLGSLNYQLTTIVKPVAITVDSRGNLLVADASKNQILVINPQGQLKQAIGGSGTGEGQFSGSGPEGIAMDRKGNIWATDTYAGRIQKFTPAGVFIAAYGSKGSSSGQLLEPRGIDVAPNGEVWVADWGNNRVAIFDEAGAFVKNLGSLGTANGQFKHPVAIDFDNRGVGWVVDAGNGRVQGFVGGSYYWKFGASGVGNGQFQFSSPGGLVTDASGRFWIVDPGNFRLQKWETPNYAPDYAPALGGSIGASGTGDGKFNRAADVAISPSGQLWVADSNNNRIQKFNASGDFIGKFGFLGSFPGLFSRPSAVAFDGEGNFWVADSGNNRIQKFSGAGEYKLKFGTLGSANGAFSSPEGIAIGPEGAIWVADTKNNRLQAFDAKGSFVKAIGSAGSAPGQFSEPAGLDFGLNGNLYVADAGNNRVQEFTPGGAFVREIGSAGTGNGELQRPVNVEADEEGLIWVLDSGNDRVEVFGEEGEYVRKFGSKGSDPTQFELASPAGLALELSGRLWVADTDNHRLQKWVTPAYEASELVQAEPEVPDDPEVEVEVSAGLVSAVEGDEADQLSYTHEGDDLVAQLGPEGETSYEYNSKGLLTKVKLPNGTVATMIYDSPSSRVKSVMVDPAGSEPAQWTFFNYDDQNLKTTVEREGSPKVDYYFDELGSVLKMWSAVEPPEVTLSGTLWANRETPTPINTGLHNLEITADSAHGIAAIEVMDGDVIVSEKYCQQKPEVQGTECTSESDEWVVETLSSTPGVHMIEVLVTDSIDHSASKRFWINIPYTPLPPEDELQPPTFSEIREFRKSFGLDLDLNPITQEQLLNDRIYDLLGAWENPNTPAGEVARYASSNWGVPLRPIDVSEMEYREWYVAANMPQIEGWAEAHYPGSYAGVYVDHAAGGLIKVGFTEGVAAEAAVTEMKQQLGGTLLVPSRITGYAAPQDRSWLSLEQLMEDLTDSWSTNETLDSLMTYAEVDPTVNAIRVGAIDPGAVQAAVASRYGAAAPIIVEADPDPAEVVDGRMQAGVKISSVYSYAGQAFQPGCTGGFGAYRWILRNGQRHQQQFLLTGGHCTPVGASVFKPERPRGMADYFEIGTGAYNGWPGGRGYETDAAAVRLDGIAAPRYVFRQGEDPRPVRAAGWVHPGDQVCFSGVTSGKVKCGPATGIRVLDFEEEDDPRGIKHGRGWMIKFQVKVERGDSGAPVWDRTTGRSLGILSARKFQGNPPRWYAFAAPLIQPRKAPFAKAPGIFAAPGMNGGSPSTYLDLEEAP